MSEPQQRATRTTTSPANHRLLLVHAHPDDETIGQGALIANYVTAGAQVTLVTCTLGEEGEVLVPELENLAAANEDRLGPHRIGELSDAMAALGVTDWQFLGGEGKYRDSGMMGESTNQRENCFWQADLLEAATDLVAVIRDRRPQVLITYNDFGGYGHPDHIQAHRVAMYATQLAAAQGFRSDLGEPWRIEKIYWAANPKSVIRRGIEELRASGRDMMWADVDPDDIPFGIEDEFVTTRIDSCVFHEQKVAAMKSYPTQMTLESGMFALMVSDKRHGYEFLQLVQGEPGAKNSDGYEDDIFAGVTVD